MKDIDIAKKHKLERIEKIAKKLNIDKDIIEPYGHYKAKLPLSLIDENKVKESKLILVTAMSPTPAGEGKTTVSIGLSMGLNRIDKKSAVVLREPSLGPVFGIKGGATGGGYSQVVPMEDINLHFTGDMAAIEKANNLLAAMIDNSLHFHNGLHLDARTIKFKRVIDMNDRALRNTIIGLGGSAQGVPRENNFKITAASEVMAILCLAKDIKDLKQRLGNIFVGYSYEGKAIFAKDLNAHGAMAALLKDAIKPNLVQTLEYTPAIIHGGPFANIAQGTNSIIATKMGMTLSDYVVTEAGFGSDLGAEKFFDIKCREGNLKPRAVVLVATIRALKYHGGVKLNDLTQENVDAVSIGFDNLSKHIENIKLFGFTPTVAINKFTNDTDREINKVVEMCNYLGVKAIPVDVWAKGGEGALALAEAVSESAAGCEKCFNFLYKSEDSIKVKIEKIATKLYGAAHVDYSVQTRKQLKIIEDLGLSHLPVCIAKTQKSFSDNPKLLNRPKNFTLTIRDIEISSGAGFIVPIAGTIMRMPGLPKRPSAVDIDINDDGEIEGLF